MNKLDVAKLEVQRLTDEIADLTAERDFWQKLVVRESAAHIPSHLTLVLPDVEANGNNETDGSSDEADYGQKTDTLRRYVVSRAEGVSMKELKSFAQSAGLDTNTVYRFTNRMKRAKELEVIGGKYVGLPKMFQRLETK